MDIEIDYMTLLPGAGRSDSDSWLLCWLLSNVSIKTVVDTLETVVLLLACGSQSSQLY